MCFYWEITGFVLACANIAALFTKIISECVKATVGAAAAEGAVAEVRNRNACQDVATGGMVLLFLMALDLGLCPVGVL